VRQRLPFQSAPTEKPKHSSRGRCTRSRRADLTELRG